VSTAAAEPSVPSAHPTVDNVAPAGLIRGRYALSVGYATLAYGYAHLTPAAFSRSLYTLNGEISNGGTTADGIKKIKQKNKKQLYKLNF
jgi:hypothetical protein